MTGYSDIVTGHSGQTPEIGHDQSERPVTMLWN